jgi:GNAT superfamily N-acetyltransferase
MYKRGEMMTFREAQTDDIKRIQVVRNSVTENILSDPARVTDKDCEDYITVRGKGWVCEIDYSVIGFAIADLKENNIWALFINPKYERMGIGKKLHDIMLEWYFSKTKEKVWLSTAPGTRAEMFYRNRGWNETGKHGNAEIKFEMTYDQWKSKTNL